MPIQAITYEDRAFCDQKLPEGYRLDYKQDLPDDILKSVAAMANTDGG